MTQKKVRLNADLHPEVAGALKALASSQSVSLSEAVRRSISLMYCIQQELDQGSKVLIEKNGKLKELVFCY
jgi:hypothetical protein